MDSFKMQLSELIKPEKNVRIHTEQQLKEFERSVKMFGQIRPIVIDEKKIILAGNGLYETLVRMGYEEADVYQYTNLTESQKKKLMIADNKIFSLGIENLDTLDSFLNDLRDDLDIPGFDSDVLQQMVSDAEDITEKLSEYGTLDDEEIKEIKERTERRESKMEPQTPIGGGNVAEPIGKVSDTTTDESKEEETTDIKKFVICPSCGEKIWL